MYAPFFFNRSCWFATLCEGGLQFRQLEFPIDTQENMSAMLGLLLLLLAVSVASATTKNVVINSDEELVGDEGITIMNTRILQ